MERLLPYPWGHILSQVYKVLGVSTVRNAHSCHPEFPALTRNFIDCGPTGQAARREGSLVVQCNAPDEHEVMVKD